MSALTVKCNPHKIKFIIIIIELGCNFTIHFVAR